MEKKRIAELMQQYAALRGKSEELRAQAEHLRGAAEEAQSQADHLMKEIQSNSTAEPISTDDETKSLPD